MSGRGEGEEAWKPHHFCPLHFAFVVLESFRLFVIFLVCFCCASRGKDLGFLARCFEGGGGLLAFEVVKSGDSDFWLWRGRNKKKGGTELAGWSKR